ncbi:MAG TPA: hypothetical protein VHV57_11400 [Acidimicrobiales bacterium]|jgi:hypothetical protein|nr:hypothetical protein [Acidimicrobiales bacterium]
MTSDTAEPREARVKTLVGVANLPDDIRRHAALPDADYADAFIAPTIGAPEQTPEWWARAFLEESKVGRRAPILWTLMGLRLGPRPSADHTQGWRIAKRGEGWIRVETGSWCMTTHAVVSVDDHEVSLALFIRFDKPLARVMWAPIAAMHRNGAPSMVSYGVRAHESALLA